MIPERQAVPYSELVALLPKAEFFSRLLPDDLYWLASRSGVYRYTEGSRVFSPGEAADRFFIVRQGSVRLERDAEGGRIDPLATFLKGDVLGDFDFARQGQHDARALAAKESSLLVFPDIGQTMTALAAERPDICARMLLRSVSMISSRIRSTQLLISENAPWVRELRRSMFTDTATGLWLRSYLDEELSRRLASQVPVGLVLFKPDGFKQLCDRHGHAAGDLAMARIAAILLDRARRHGGWALRLRSNETALVLPRCDLVKAGTLAREVAESVRGIDLRDSYPLCAVGFTLSAVVASWEGGNPGLRLCADRAHENLTRVWQEGGNRLRGPGILLVPLTKVSEAGDE